MSRQLVPANVHSHLCIHLLFLFHNSLWTSAKDWPPEKGITDAEECIRPDPIPFRGMGKWHGVRGTSERISKL